MIVVALLAMLALALLGALPLWPYSSKWGIYPSVSIAVMLLAVIALHLLNVI